MRRITVKTFKNIAFALALVIAATSLSSAQSKYPRLPELPAGCENLEVPAGNAVAFKVYASGVQVYTWNGTNWGFVGPLADLYANPGLNGKVGTHYGGPTWKSVSGSYVIGKNPIRCTPDPDSIPWLLLEADATSSNGIFAGVTYIQRVNTLGGNAPAEPGTLDGEQTFVPYTTVYVFYKWIQ